MRTPLGSLLFTCAHVFLVGLLLEMPASAQVPLALSAVSPDSSAADKIEEALAKRHALTLLDTPLREALDHIAQKSGLAIKLSKKIEDAGVQPDQPVTIKVQNITLNSALNLMLADLNLTTTIQNETLVITTIEDAQSPENMITRVYPVKDLLDAGNDYDPLIELITSTLEPDSWQDVGGPGSISGFENSASLVTSQRRDIHQRIGALLMTLRQAKSVQGISSRSPVPTRASSPLASSRLLSSPLPSSGNRYSRGPLRRGEDSAAPSWSLPQLYEAKE
ncbi:STN domain-containing protein [Anatilimnocola sp. NA78]|uniref:STN domain-containing protein n=1 Tax=Anatilimnocola sp. NA78 TaxID=3415683 RepID=UPI003CE59A13